jgi:hypothetical protein
VPSQHVHNLPEADFKGELATQLTPHSIETGMRLISNNSRRTTILPCAAARIYQLDVFGSIREKQGESVSDSKTECN